MYLCGAEYHGNNSRNLRVFFLVTVSVASLVVEEGDVALLPEAVEGAGVVCEGVPVGAAHAGRVGAAQLAELVRVVAERVVPVLQRVDGAGLPEELDGGLDVVVAVGDLHDARVDQLEHGHRPAGQTPNLCKARLLPLEVGEGLDVVHGVLLDHGHGVVVVLSLCD